MAKQSLIYVAPSREAQKTGLPGQVMWDRRELDLLLRLYGQHVAGGQWRDYGIDALQHRAVFSVFRRAHEMPLYRIEKTPALRRKQGMYAAHNAHGHILKRGHHLPQILQIFKPPRDK